MSVVVLPVIMKSSFFLVAASSLLLLFLPLTCHGDVLLSSLPQTLVVSASPVHGEVVKAGEDIINITWGVNQCFAHGKDASYSEVKLKLCYAPESQLDREWRRTSDNLRKDQTCQFTIARRNYTRKDRDQTFVGTIEKDVPTAFYFVRVYAYDSTANKIAYGQTTDDKKSTNLFEVQGISGSSLSIEVASVCLSAFALLSAVGFIFMEMRSNESRK